MVQQPVTTIISRNPVQKINKAFYFWSYIGASVLMLALIAIAISVIVTAINARVRSEDLPAIILSVIGLILLIILLSVLNIIVSLIPLYRAWRAIQDGHASTSPGEAVGFLFIPYFSLYWIFPAYWGYARDYNAYLARYSLGLPKMSEGLFMADCILNVSTVVFSVLVLPAIIVLDAIIIYKMCEGINSLAGQSPQH